MECQKINQNLKQMCCEKIVKVSTTDILEIFRLKLLGSGASCIKSIARSFRIADRDKTRCIDFEEFTQIFQRKHIKNVSENDLKKLFAYFDKDGSGCLSFDEFLLAVRPPMDDQRKNLVMKAFAKMDRSGDGFITVDDLMKTYDVKKHPKFINGEASKRQLIAEFLESFEVDDHCQSEDEGEEIVITKDEWMDYYSAVGASIDNFAYFELMMRSAWEME